jgi:proton-dependent oligopeptide transporter, POT family
MKQGHPKALYYLFFAELWERFSYYGMRALLLVLYIVTRSYMSAWVRTPHDIRGIEIYAAFGALVYATPVVGGMIADRFLGYRKAIVTGWYHDGHRSVYDGIRNTEVFFYCRFRISCNRKWVCLSPISHPWLVVCIAQGDPRSDAGFTIFYMGINLGAFISPLVCGYVA